MATPIEVVTIVIVFVIIIIPTTVLFGMLFRETVGNDTTQGNKIIQFVISLIVGIVVLGLISYLLE